ncbi:hypothetical protein I4U23_000062 [Adineta vaga]|nr:hypothetical protein I4U23_000062 [Adineta vaga]
MHYGGRSVVTIGDILVVVLLYAQSVASLGFMGLFLQSFAEARGAAVQVFRLIDEAEETDEYGKQIWDGTHSYKESININGDIEFSNVYFAYPARQESPILRNLSLVARADETTALVGLSGCGKSTCVSLILRYYEPSSGSVTLNGRPIAEYDIKQLRQNIGVVSQEPILFGTSIYENIRYGNLNATSLQIEEAARQANAHNFIMQLPDKYNTLVGERGAQLSGGEKQRVALARALVKQPTLLLLDEATSALDNTNERVVQKALDEACKSRTTIVITHRLTTVKNAHHIYVLDKGNVVEEGTHETLMAKEGGKYQNMVKAQETERWNDNAYETMTKQEIEDEDEKEITERSRLLSNAEVINAERKSLSSVARRNTLLRLLSMNSPEWKTILAGCIAAICGGVTMPIMAYLLSKIVHALRECIYSERQRQVLIVSSLFLLIGLLTIVIRFFQYTAFALSGSKLTQRVRAKAFADFLRQEVAYFDRPENSSGSICARLSSDALALQQITGTRLGVIFETLTVIVFGFILGVFFSWQLTLIVFIGVMINFSVSYININLQAQLTKRSNLLLEQGSSLAVEVIHNMRTVKQLTIEKEVLRQYSEIVYTVFIMRRKTAIIVAIGIGVIWGLHSFVLAALYWRALVLVEQHELNSRNVIMIFAFATFFLQIMQICLSMCDDIGTSITGAQSFFDLFDRTPTIDNRSTEGQELFDFHGEIEFNQIKFAYPTRPRSSVLNNFQLTIKPNQRVALVGASGCGKSTIVQLLERFYDVTSGQLRLDGVDIRQLNIYSVRSCIGLVSQEPVLFDMTIAENIAYGKETFSLEDVMAAATKANVHEFIQQLPQGYATKVGMKGGFLSGGEKQRIAIARTIFRRPKLLLLDESTSAMDSHNERIVQQALEKTQEEDPSRASLIIAHRLSTIRSCDLICVVDSGRIVESGTHDELMKQHGAYYRMLIRNSS